MDIAIVAEDETDLFICSNICKKILSRNIRVRLENRFINNTQVLPKDIVKIKKFLDKKKKRSPRFLVIITDRDSNRQLKNNLKKELDKVSVANYVIAIPEETIEDWLIEDISTINKVLICSLSPPPKSKNAKIWLQGQIGQYKPGQKNSDVYKSISDNINLRELRNNNSFGSFEKDLKNTVSSLSREPISQPSKLGSISKDAKKAYMKMRRRRVPLPGQIRLNK